MTQPWKNNFSIIDFHGSYGSISGSPAAADRYTEQRLSKEASFLITDGLKNNSVDFRPNYSQDENEPIVMPVKLPLLLINGSFGLAAGFMSSIPLHNPREVIDELISYIKDNDYTVNLLPDFPTGGEIINTERIKFLYQNFMEEKDNNIIMRAVLEKDEDKNFIYIRELPYMVTCDTLIVSIKNATIEGKDNFGRTVQPKIIGINNIKNLTEGNNVKIAIEIKNGYDLDTIEAQLYKYTLCQKSVIMSFIAVQGKELIEFKNINEVFDRFLTFRKATIKRIKSNNIRKYKLRMHIIEGLLKLLKGNIINQVIKDIRQCKNKAEVISMLIDKYELTSIQAENIAEYKLYRLSSLEINNLEVEYKDLSIKVDEELEYFKNESKLDEYLIDELEHIKDAYFPAKKFSRRTKLSNITISSNEEMLATIQDKDYMIYCTKYGYIKKIELPETQKRNTKGISVGKLKPNDYVINVTTLNSRDTFYIFTNVGKVYKFNAYNIPECTTKTLGHNISSNINDETIISMIPIKPDEFNDENKYLAIASKKNLIKLVSLNEFKNVRGQTGLLASKLKEDDELINVIKIDITSGTSIIALNSVGDAIRVPISEIPINKRTTYGSNLFWSKLINEYNGEVVCISLVDTSKKYYFVITSNGLGKRMNFNEFDCQRRSTKGKMVCKLKENDYPVKLLCVDENDSILIVSNKKLVNIECSEMRVIARSTYGYKVKNCDEDEYVVDATVSSN